VRKRSAGIRSRFSVTDRRRGDEDGPPQPRTDPPLLHPSR